MLMTFEAGASIPNNLTDFYNQAFYTLYQRHDASKSGYKCELKTKLSPEEFKSVLSYVGMKTFFDSQVDFNTSTVDKAIRRYQEKINIKMSSFDFIFDATNSACMLIQEGTDLKFSHRSFQEYFAALGINQLDDKLQKQILLQWVKEDRNNISAHKTFMNSLFSIQKERTYKNLCLPVIEKMEELYLGMPDIDFVIQNCFKHFRLAKGKTNQKGIGFGLADDYAYYFSLQFIIFHSIGKDISSVHNKEEVELLEMKLYDLLEEDQRYSFNDLVEEEKVLLRQWIDNWYMARHRFLKQWAKEFVENSSTQKRTLQNIMNSI